MKKLNCSSCNKQIKPGGFMAILAEYPTKTHVGRTEAIINKWLDTSNGAIYCKKCFEGKCRS